MCELGWEPFKGNCYKINRENKNWTSSENDCVEEGAHLTSILSQEENDFLLQFTRLKDTRFYNFMGLTQDDGDAGLWTDGSGFDYENFYAITSFGRCNAFMSGYGVGSGQWTGYACHGALSSICKKPMEGNHFVVK